MNSIELLKQMLSFYFEPDSDGVHRNGIRYMGNMPTIIRGFIDIVVLVNEDELKVELYLNREKEKLQNSPINYSELVRQDMRYPLLAETTLTWDEFKFKPLINWMIEKTEIDF